MIDLLGEMIREVEDPAITSFSGEYAWLSNFWAAPVLAEGEWYPTVEHAFQAAKTYDPQLREQIRACKTPGDAKRAGRATSPRLLREDWDAVKREVMYGLVLDKFTRYSDLSQRLKATDSTRLIEGNTWNDKYWGICTKTDQGENHLGKILMRVRDVITRD